MNKTGETNRSLKAGYIRFLFLITFLITGCAGTDYNAEYRKLADEASQKATEAANGYAVCMNVGTILYKDSDESASDIAEALQSKCWSKLNSYERWMHQLYLTTTARHDYENAGRLARSAKEDLQQEIRIQVIESILDDRMKE